MTYGHTVDRIETFCQVQVVVLVELSNSEIPSRTILNVTVIFKVFVTVLARVGCSTCLTTT